MPPSSRDPDPFRTALYAAEDEALPGGGRRFRRFTEVEAYVDNVLLGDWWGATFPHAPLEVEISRRSRGATYSAARVADEGDVAVLWLRDGSWQLVTVVHELAHVAAWGRADPARGGEPHGVEFATVLLSCWRELLGFDAYGALRSGFDRRSVPYHRDSLR